MERYRLTVVLSLIESHSERPLGQLPRVAGRCKLAMRNHLGPRKRSFFVRWGRPKPIFCSSTNKIGILFLNKALGSKRSRGTKRLKKYKDVVVAVSMSVIGGLRFSGRQQQRQGWRQHHQHEHGDHERSGHADHHLVEQHRCNDRRHHEVGICSNFGYPRENGDIFGKSRFN
jgi:hypothetical protein